MAAVSINRVSLPHNSTGYNLTDSTGFTELVAGAGNGVEFDWVNDSIVVLKNDTGNSATFTTKIRVIAGYTAYSANVSNPTVAVANGKTVLLRLDDIFRDSDGMCTIECDVAGKVLVLAP